MRSKKLVLPAVVAGSLAAVGLLTVWLSRPAAAQLSGVSQVTRLEVRYLPATDSVEARFHLATGLALTETAESEVAGTRLFQAAQILAQGNARMFVTASRDRVESWHLSVP